MKNTIDYAKAGETPPDIVDRVYLNGEVSDDLWVKVDAKNGEGQKYIDIQKNDDLITVKGDFKITINMPTVIAFSGERGSGKSAAAEILIKDHGFRDVKFADPLKNMLRAFYATCGVSDSETERRIEGKRKEIPCDYLNGCTPRHAMQTLGTEWRDMISTTLWSDIFVQRVKSGMYGQKIVCTDYRFPHETDALDAVGATVHRIVRPGTEKTDKASQHVSETLGASLPYNSIIENTGTIEELHKKIVLILADTYVQD